jgi:GNAT superfamily N-acetyltransferase
LRDTSGETLVPGPCSRLVTTPQAPARPATTTDRQRLAEVLAAAFADDPVFEHLLPMGIRRRQQRLRRIFELEIPRSLRHEGLWSAADGAGAALWYPPGQWRAPLWTTIWQGPAATRAFGRRTVLASQTLAMLQKHHPSQPHWYLLYLGTEPARQGTGIGSSLLRPMLERCDQQGIPAYLEATTERNRALYRRHGFADSGEPLPMPGNGPSLYPMWRDPR